MLPRKLADFDAFGDATCPQQSSTTVISRSSFALRNSALIAFSASSELTASDAISAGASGGSMPEAETDHGRFEVHTRLDTSSLS